MRIDSVKLVIIIALLKGLDYRHVVFVTALLNGELVGVDIYMEQPKGYQDETDRVCQLLIMALNKLPGSATTRLVQLNFQQDVFDSTIATALAA